MSSSHLVDTLTNRPEVKHGWGLHKEDVPQDDLLQAMKVQSPNEHQTPSSTITKLPNEPVELFVAQILYKATITCTKVSILLLYRRIFAIDKFLRLIWIVMAVVVAYGVVSILATIFQCQPLHKAYEARYKVTASTSLPLGTQRQPSP
jgi:hypothetical protein